MPLAAERRNEGDQHDQTGVDHQLGNLGNPANVLDAVGVGEAEILVQPMPDVVAIEDVCMPPERDELLLHQVGDGRLARPGEAGEPEHAGLLTLQPRTALLIHGERLPVNIGSAAQGEVDHPGADGCIGEAVDQDEAAGGAVFTVGVEGECLGQRQVAYSYFVERQRLSRLVLQRGDVDLVFQSADLRRDRRRAALQEVAAPRKQRVLVQPHDFCLKLVGMLRPPLRSRQKVAPADIDLVCEGQSHRLSGQRFLQVTALVLGQVRGPGHDP